MRYGIGLIAFFVGVLWMVEPALATCTTEVVTMPNGKTMFCTICCYGKNAGCTRTCH